MLRRYILSFILICSFPLYAAQVVKVGKDKRVIAVTHDSGQSWSVGEQVCIFQSGENIACGEVIKSSKAGAIVKLESAAPTISRGDSVKSKSGEEGESVSSSSSSSHGKWKSGAGFLLGANLGTVTIENTTTTYTSRTGIAFGGFFELPIGSVFLIQPELFYVQKGAVSSTTVATIVADSVDKFDYIELPLLFKAKFHWGFSSPFILAGPYFAYLMGAKTDVTVSGASSASSSTDVKSTLTTIDFGTYFGVGSDFTFSNSLSAVVVARYGYGLTGIVKDATIATKLRGIQFLTGLKFSF